MMRRVKVGQNGRVRMGKMVMMVQFAKISI